MTDQSGIRCPKCGAYLAGEIAEGAYYVKCRYCSTTLLLPKREPRQQIQPVVVLTKNEARQIEKYGKLLSDMTEEGKKEAYAKEYEESKRHRKQAALMWRDPWLKRVTFLELRKRDEGLSAKEERELAFSTNVLTKCSSSDEYYNSFHKEYCLGCFRKKEVSCVNCGIRVCGYDDCELIYHEFADHFSRQFVMWDGKAYVSLYCPNCKGFVHPSCSIRLWTRCGKCRTKLEKKPPHADVMP